MHKYNRRSHWSSAVANEESLALIVFAALACYSAIFHILLHHVLSSQQNARNVLGPHQGLRHAHVPHHNSIKSSIPLTPIQNIHNSKENLAGTVPPGNANRQGKKNPTSNVKRTKPFAVDKRAGRTAESIKAEHAAADKIAEPPKLDENVKQDAKDIYAKLAASYEKTEQTANEISVATAVRSSGAHLLPLLVITCQRADYLRRTLESVFRHHPLNPDNKEYGPRFERGKNEIVSGVPIILSQDGKDVKVIAVIEEFKKRFEGELGVPVNHIIHTQKIINKHNRIDHTGMYQKLSAHYKFALGQSFDNPDMRLKLDSLSNTEEKHDVWIAPAPQALIILEEDLEIAPDFFEYMTHFAPLMIPFLGSNNATDIGVDNSRHEEGSIMAISAFSDNGRDGLVPMLNADTSEPEAAARVLRTDFFPGLGWMMPRFLWDEVGPIWPEGWWDDWLRDPARRKGREFIRPEISRTYHFGEKGGASENWQGKIIKRIQLNQIKVPWNDLDVASSLEKSTYDAQYWSQVSNAKLIKQRNLKKNLARVNSENVRLEYSNLKEFAKLAQKLEMMPDEKANIPRTAYKGVVEVRLSGGRFFLFITPPLEEVKKNLLRLHEK